TVILKVRGQARSDVRVVEGVEQFADQLHAEPVFLEAEALGHAQIKRLDRVSANGIASDARRAVGAVVAVVVQIGAQKFAERLVGCDLDDAAEFPTAEQSARRAFQVLEVIQLPQAVEHETMRSVGVPRAAVVAEQEGLLRLFSVVATADY